MDLDHFWNSLQGTSGSENWPIRFNKPLRIDLHRCTHSGWPGRMAEAWTSRRGALTVR